MGLQRVHERLRDRLDGLRLAGLGSAAILATVALWLTRVFPMPDWGWAAMGFLVLWNVQFLAIAVLGEYIVRTHRHTQGRPLYVVDCVIEGGRSR